MCLAQGHNAVMLVRLKPSASQSRVKHFTTEQLGSLHHDGYFFSPTLIVIFKILYELFQFGTIFCVCSNLINNFTNEFSRCRNGCKHSLAPKNEREIAFQALVLFLMRFETNGGISIY